MPRIELFILHRKVKGKKSFSRKPRIYFSKELTDQLINWSFIDECVTAYFLMRRRLYLKPPKKKHMNHFDSTAIELPI